MNDEDLIEAIGSFATTLRMGDGLDSVQYQKVRDELSRRSTAWRVNGNTLPCATASVLVELYPAMYGSAALYDNETERQIMDVAGELVDEIQHALNTD